MKLGLVDISCDPKMPGQTGLSSATWNMARALASQGHEVVVAGPYSSKPRDSDMVSLLSFSVPPGGFRNVAGQSLLVLNAWRRLARIPDLRAVIAAEYHTTGLLAPWVKIPCVLVTPGNIYERIANGNPFDWWTTQAYKVFARSSARFCTLVDAVSEEMMMWWRYSGTPEDRLVRIPYGVDPVQFRRHSRARAQLRLPEGRRHVVYAGRLSAEKHVETLFSATTRLSVAGHPIHAHVLGDGPQRPLLEQAARTSGVESAVTFHGDVAHSDMPHWFSAADAVVLPSTSEGLPRVMLEAMACEAPFVGASISGIVDVIRHGENGLLFEPLDDAALAAQLEHIFGSDELRAEMGRQARETILAGFTWERMTKRLVEEISARC